MRPAPARWLLPPVMGRLLELSDGDGSHGRLYLTGDTLMYDGLREIAWHFDDYGVFRSPYRSSGRRSGAAGWPTGDLRRQG